MHGRDGRVPPLAHVRVIDPGTDATDEAVVRKDGGFVLKSRRRGLAWLELTAVDHAAFRVPIVLDGTAIRFDATLGTYAPADDRATPEIHVWKKGAEDSEPTVFELQRQSNGDLAAEVPTSAKRVAVQIANVAGLGRSVNAPGATAYEYDGAGDYYGMFEPAGGKLRIVMTQAQQPRGDAPKLAFTPADSPAARVAALGELWQPTLRVQTPADTPALWQRAKDSDDALVRRIATAMALAIDRRNNDELAADERALAEALVASTPFGDALWAFMPGGVVRAADIGGKPELVERVLAEQLGPEQSAMVLLGMLASASDRGDEARTRELWAKISKPPYAELGLVEMAAAWNPDRKVKRGGVLPRFEAAQLGATQRLRSEDLGGKIVLIELWATWCQPCVEAMDELHALHGEYAGPGFEILSISMDEEAALVEKFRARWPMPWLHVFGGDDREKLYTAFETATLPYTVLVGADGTILEAAAAMEPGELRRWLERHVPQAPAEHAVAQ